MCIPSPPKIIGFNRCYKVFKMRLGKRFESNELAFKQSYVGKIHVLNLAWPNNFLPLKDKAGRESSRVMKGRQPLPIWGRFNGHELTGGKAGVCIADASRERKWFRSSAAVPEPSTAVKPVEH